MANNKTKKTVAIKKVRCVCGHTKQDHSQEIGVCVNQGYDRSGIPTVCWCNEYEAYVPRSDRERSLSTAKRRNPNFYGKGK